jgi:hypothetical protein
LSLVVGDHHGRRTGELRSRRMRALRLKRVGGLDQDGTEHYWRYRDTHDVPLGAERSSRVNVVAVADSSRREEVMKERTFADLMGSLNEALEHAKGKRDLRTTNRPLPPARRSMGTISLRRNPHLAPRSEGQVEGNVHSIDVALFLPFCCIQTRLVAAIPRITRIVAFP